MYSGKEKMAEYLVNTSIRMDFFNIWRNIRNSGLTLSKTNF